MAVIDRPRVIAVERPYVTDVAAFLRESGRRSFRTSASSFQLALQSRRVQLRAYHRALSTRAPDGAPLPYVFHDLLGNDDRREGLRTDRWRAQELQRWSTRCPAPAFFRRMSQDTPALAARIAFGPAGTHSGLHRHGASICQLVFGSKRWVLHDAVVTSRLKPLIEGLRVPSPQLTWWNEVVPRIEGVRGDVRAELRRVLLAMARRHLFDRQQLVHLEAPLDATQVVGERFTQRPGEIVYLPPQWGHATINEAWSLAYVVELARLPTGRPRDP